MDDGWDGGMHACMDEWMGGYMEVWLTLCVYGWMDKVDGWTDACLHTYSTCETFLRASILDLRIDTCTACGLACHVAHVWHVCVWHMPTRFVTDAWQRQIYIDAWVDERMELHGWRTTHGASAAVHGCAHIFMYCMVAALIPGTPDPARQIRCIIGNYTTIVRRRSQVDTQPAKIMRGPWTELTILWALDERAEKWDSSVGLSKIGKCFG